MSHQQQPSIETLDRLFANHFGVSPMVSQSGSSASLYTDRDSLGGYSSSSQSYLRTPASLTSTVDSMSPRTPAMGPNDLFGNNGVQSDRRKPNVAYQSGYGGGNEMDAPQGIGLTLNDDERATKAQELLNALAQLYAQPSASPQLDRSHPTAVTPTRRRPKENIEIAPHQQSIPEQDGEFSPRSFHSVCSDLDEREEEGLQQVPEDANDEEDDERLEQIHEEDSDHAHDDRRSHRTSGSSYLAAGVDTGAFTRPPRAARGAPAVEDQNATIWPMEQNATMHEVARPEDVGNLRARRQSRVGTSAVRPMATLTQVRYMTDAIPQQFHDPTEASERLVEVFPHLCDAPHTLQYDDQGVALPPLKYEETSEKERRARRQALQVHMRGQKMHTLIKAMVVLESRSTHWKKIGSQASKMEGGAEANRYDGHASTAPLRGSSRQAAPRLPEIPDPWAMNFMHSDTDTLNIKGTARRVFELSESRAYGQCPKCQGSGQGICGLCKGAEPDECFWCQGSGHEQGKGHVRCQPCQGSGKLACKSCRGTLKSNCRTCDGEGRGEFCAYVQIKVRRVDFAPIPVTSIVAVGSAHDAATVKSAAIARTWEAINKLTSASDAKHKHPMRPLAASCTCQTSWSDLVEVEVPQTVKLTKSHSSAGGLIRSRSLTHLRGHGAKQKSTTAAASSSTNNRHYYFVLPSDPDLQPAEVNADEFQLALMPETEAPRSDLPHHMANAAHHGQPTLVHGNAAPTFTASSSSSSAYGVAGVVGGQHQRSHSARQVPTQSILSSASASGFSQPLARPAPHGSSLDEVAAWQARLQAFAPLHQTMPRAVSPTSQMESLAPDALDSRSQASGGGGTPRHSGHFGTHASPVRAASPQVQPRSTVRTHRMVFNGGEAF